MMIIQVRTQLMETFDGDEDVVGTQSSAATTGSYTFPIYSSRFLTLLL